MNSEQPTTTTDFDTSREEGTILPAFPLGAIVRLPEKGGTGILVERRWILTAAHCVSYSGEGWARNGELHATVIAGDAEVRCALVAVEHGCGIAALARPSASRFPKDAKAFDRFCEKAGLLSVCPSEEVLFQDLYFYDHHAGWIQGWVLEGEFEGEATAVANLSGKIPHEATGGPVVNKDGCVVGILTHGSLAMGDDPAVQFCRPDLALPFWLSREMFGNGLIPGIQQLYAE